MKSKEHYSVPKYEILQQVKMVMVRHGVDLTRLRHTTAKKVLYIDGYLTKDPIGDFKPFQVANLLKDLERLPYELTIQPDLDNFDISNEFGHWRIRAKTSRVKIKYV